jgi:hypothetical protein
MADDALSGVVSSMRGQRPSPAGSKRGSTRQSAMSGQVPGLQTSLRSPRARCWCTRYGTPLKRKAPLDAYAINEGFPLAFAAAPITPAGASRL